MTMHPEAAAAVVSGSEEEDAAAFGEPWPLTLADQYRISGALADEAAIVLSGIEDPGHRRVFELAVVTILSVANNMAATAVVAAAAPGHRVLDGSALVAYLAGDRSDLPPARFAGISTADPPWMALRRLARIMSWCPPWRLPRAIRKPDAVAISHNGLLQATARNHAIGFRHATSILNAARPGSPSPTGFVEPLADTLAERLAAVPDTTPAVRARLQAALCTLVRQELSSAAADLDRMRSVDDLPRAVWSGSAGYRPSRAIGLEVVRRGGTVTRFDHGGGLGIRREHSSPAFVEFVGSTHICMPTPELARRLNEGGREAPVSLIPRPQAWGGRGDPTYAAALLPRRPHTGRRVLYGTPPLIGERGVFPPIYPDAVGLVLQRRLIRALKTLPVDLLLRPHPEGLRGGPGNPLAALHPCEDRSYEELLPEADVLLFDHICTTTFTIALCTDRPVVVLDYGIRFFQDDIEAFLERRCARLPVSLDDMNLPRVDAKELGAVIEDLPDRVDPEPFRSMFLGDLAA